MPNKKTSNHSQETRDYNRSVGRNARGNSYLASIMKMQDKHDCALRDKWTSDIVNEKMD